MRKKVLLVEDEDALRMLYGEELEGEGYEVLKARNGKEALQQFDQGDPDLVLLDIVMPVMDGMETLARMKEKKSDIPVILHTSHRQYQKDRRSLAADALITKSSDLGEMKEKVRELLGRNGTARGKNYGGEG
jgi:two-component system response regulator (stage 0 sporulation protein F)